MTSRTPPSLTNRWRKRDKTLRQHVVHLFQMGLHPQAQHATKRTMTTLAQTLETQVYQRYVLDPVKDIHTVSQVVEQNTLCAYRNAARLLCRSLSENKALRDDILSGNISVTRAVEMRPRDLHPQATMWADQEKRAKEYDAKKTNAEAEQARKTKLLQQESGTYSPRCPKCHTTNITFYQLQTRSGDEGMTTFYSCLAPSCQIRWRR